MSRRESSGARSAFALLTVVALGAAIAYAQQATAEDKEQYGPVVTISPNDGPSTLDHAESAEATAGDHPHAQPKYWLGLQGAPLDSAVLRTHLQLADGVGIVVENVVKDSPAEKAGLRRHDVLIAVNGEQVTDMVMLQQAVGASEGKPVELKVIRLAKEETMSATPEERPAHLAQAAPDMGLGAFHGDMAMGDLQRMLQQMQGGVRVFGPGMVMNGQQMGMMQFPGGVEVKITREGNGPATVTVTRNGESWTVKGDDKEALAKLPEDLRPAVEQLLRGQRLGQGGFPNLPNLPEIPGVGDLRAAPRQLGLFHFEDRADANQQLLQRLQELETQLQQLEQRFSDEHSAPGTNPQADPSNH